jgi:hypothetical protein
MAGSAIGAGFCVSLATDLRVCSPAATVGLTFVKLGLHPGMGCTFFAPRVMGTARANYWLLTVGACVRPVLCCAVLCCAVLCCAVLCCAVGGTHSNLCRTTSTHLPLSPPLRLCLRPPPPQHLLRPHRKQARLLLLPAPALQRRKSCLIPACALLLQWLIPITPTTSRTALTARRVRWVEMQGAWGGGNKAAAVHTSAAAAAPAAAPVVNAAPAPAMISKCLVVGCRVYTPLDVEQQNTRVPEGVMSIPVG